ncbi:MAG: Crp/Fnr family transcriptional regulator [Blastochloris sp.]|nr:Crp/Fnr family transcriptional regulator [Blastochloris sp.]
MSQIKTYQPGETIICQKAECDGVYIVAKGMVSISTQFEGRQIELATLGRGSMFGEMAVIDLKNRSATATALQETEIVQVEADEFQSNLHSLPLWAQLLIQMLVRRLRAADEQLARIQGLNPVLQVPIFPNDQEKDMIVESKDLAAEEIAKEFVT